MKSDISQKIVLSFVSTVTATSLSLGSFRLYESYKKLVDGQLNKKKNEANLIASNINARIEELKNDTSFLSATPPIQGILRSTKNSGIDPLDGSTTEVWKKRLKTIFTEMLHSKQNYEQIRYIGVKDEGREIVRVERASSKVIQVDEERLQRKGKRDYFRETINLRSDNIYLSDFTLNEEFGKIVVPFQLVLRAAVPIFNKKGTPFGIIIINMGYNHIFESLRRSTTNYSDYFVTDNLGNILLHSDKRFDLTGESSKIRHLSEYLPEYSASTAGSDLTAFETQGEKAKVIVSRKLYYNPLNKEQFLNIFLATANSNFLQTINEEILVELVIVLVLVILSIVIATFVSKKIINPLNKLTQLVPYLDDPAASKQLAIMSNENSEIGILADNIHRISTTLIDRNQTLKAQKEALDCTALVLETDTDGVITYANDQAISVSGYTQHDLLQRSIFSIVSKNTKSALRQLLKDGRRGLTASKEICFHSKSGSEYWVQAAFFPKNGRDGLEGFVSIQFDVTSRIEAEKGLLKAKEHAEKSARFKSEFLANMSHEIRTPISGIIGLNNFLKESALDKKQAEWVNSLDECAANLLVIINDILDLSKFESGNIEIESHPVDLHATVRSMFNLFEDQACEKSIKLKYSLSNDTPSYIKSDPARLRQILTNLISNAIKFTEGGTVSLSVSTERINNTDHLIGFSIKDTGIGIPPNRLKAIFEPFTQADSATTRKFGGTGLGLTITKRFVELMGGTIRARSIPGKGSTFHFTILATECDKSVFMETISNEESSAKAAAISDANLAKRHPLQILVAEDNLVNQKIIKTIFSKLGYSIDLVGCGEKAVEQTNAKKYDMILLDIRMPGMMGTEACQIIKRTPESASHGAWIIALTANVFKEDREEYYQIGFDEFLAKPVSKAMIAKAITNASQQISELKKEFESNDKISSSAA